MAWSLNSNVQQWEDKEEQIDGEFFYGGELGPHDCNVGLQVIDAKAEDLLLGQNKTKQ